MADHSSPQLQLLTVEEAASQYRVARSTAYRWLQNGIGPAPIRLGGRTFLLESDVHEFIREQQAIAREEHEANRRAHEKRTADKLTRRDPVPAWPDLSAPRVNE